MIELQKSHPYSKDRRWRLSQGRRTLVQLEVSRCFNSFFDLSKKRLKDKYNLSPIHTAEEMQQLATVFPENIKLYAATKDGALLAGALMYETSTVAHAQYLAASEKGRNLHALEVLVDWLLTEVYPHKSYFSFGVSTEQQGQYLNEGLVWNKESYGARTIVHDFYEIQL
ncbi:GNAT family N-acetyltransferase [Pontibacter rugosus]